MQKFCKGGGKLGVFKERGAQLQAASRGDEIDTSCTGHAFQWKMAVVL